MYLKRILLILVVALSGVVWVLTNELGIQIREKHEVASMYVSAQREIVRERDAKGREKAKAEAAYVSLETFKELNRKQFDELKKEIGNMRRLLSHQSISTSTKGSVAVKTDTLYMALGTDSVSSYSRTFTYSDDWLTASGRITADSLNFDYQVRNELKITAYRKRDTWWKVWQAKKTFVNVVNLNPNTTTDSIQTYIVK
jgi:hypothetical protein